MRFFRSNTASGKLLQKFTFLCRKQCTQLSGQNCPSAQTALILSFPLYTHSVVKGNNPTSSQASPWWPKWACYICSGSSLSTLLRNASFNYLQFLCFFLDNRWAGKKRVFCFWRFRLARQMEADLCLLSLCKGVALTSVTHDLTSSAQVPKVICFFLSNSFNAFQFYVISKYLSFATFFHAKVANETIRWIGPKINPSNNRFPPTW